MARKKVQRTGLAFTARDLASSIYEHAGSFLIRTVCDTVADALRELADKVDELDGENSTLRWDLTQAENTIQDLDGQIRMLQLELESFTPVLPLDDGPPNSTTGGQGFA